MTKRWRVKSARGEYLVGFFADGRANWRFLTVTLGAALANVYSTEDLAQIVIPALANANVDVFTVERHS